MVSAIAIGRNTAILLALSTRRSLVLSASTLALASLVVSASAFSSSVSVVSSSPIQRSYKSSTPVASSSSSCPEPEPTSGTARTMTNLLGTGYLSAQDAASLDAELMSTPGFCLEQLMELAGLAVAEAVYDVIVGNSESEGVEKPHVLLVCG
jgi:hypothetical protein